MVSLRYLTKEAWDWLPKPVRIGSGLVILVAVLAASLFERRAVGDFVNNIVSPVHASPTWTLSPTPFPPTSTPTASGKILEPSSPDGGPAIVFENPIIRGSVANISGDDCIWLLVQRDDCGLSQELCPYFRYGPAEIDEEAGTFRGAVLFGTGYPGEIGHLFLVTLAHVPHSVCVVWHETGRNLPPVSPAYLLEHEIVLLDTRTFQLSAPPETSIPVATATPITCK